jgi:phosphopantothenate-cysteine ligase
MSKYILVTAGNTSEPIDSVRSITNTASGKLGSIIADGFISRGEDVVYVCGKSAARPAQSPVQTVTVEGVADLARAVKDLCISYRFDCIIHSMAVSDYTVKGILPYEELTRAAEQGTQPVIGSTQGKLSSDIPNPVILLEKAPKVIRLLRDLQPQALLVGFKLLVGVTEDELYLAARKLMEMNDCDYICANDLNHIAGDRHEALLIDRDGHCAKLATKQQIADAVINNILIKWRNQK